jgi:hypothetical protein
LIPVPPAPQAQAQQPPPAPTTPAPVVPDPEPLVKPGTATKPTTRGPLPPPRQIPVTPSAPRPPEPQPMQLGAILSPERRSQYQAELKQSLAAARASMAQTSRQTLNPAQRETLARIQTFIQQAETMSGTDLATAVQLARRAELLGGDLVKSLR